MPSGFGDFAPFPADGDRVVLRIESELPRLVVGEFPLNTAGGGLAAGQDRETGKKPGDPH